MIFVPKALGIFYVVYEISGNLIAGVVVGFALHFVTLVFSPKISINLHRGCLKLKRQEIL